MEDSINANIEPIKMCCGERLPPITQSGLDLKLNYLGGRVKRFKFQSVCLQLFGTTIYLA